MRKQKKLQAKNDFLVNLAQTTVFTDCVMEHPA